METAVTMLNQIFDFLWIPFSKTPSYFDILIISAISAILFLIIFKKTSNQERIKTYKNKIIGNILQIRLYKDYPSLTIRSILSIFGYNFIYLRYALVPLVFIIVPVLVISVQLNNRYGYSPFQIDKPFIIRAELDRTEVPDVRKSIQKTGCITSEGMVLETPPMGIVNEASILWRARIIDAKSPEHAYTVTMAGKPGSVNKRVLSGKTKEGISPEKTKWHLNNLFVNNGEGFIPDSSPFKAVSVTYEHATYPFLLWKTDPIILYFIWTLIFGFVFKPVIKVSI